MFLAVSYDHKYPLCTLVSKSNVTLAQPLRLKKCCNLLHGSHCRVIGACIVRPENETEEPMWMD